MKPQERAEKIRNAPSNSRRFFKKLTPAQRDTEIRRALEHDNDAGMSAVDEYVYQKKQATEGK